MAISIRLEKDIEQRLNALAQITGRTKTFYIREAISEKLADLEDIYIAEQRIEKPARVWTMGEVEQDIGLAD